MKNKKQICFSPSFLRALQQRIFGLQLGQLPAQAVDFVLKLLVVFDDVDHFIVGLIQALGGPVPAQKHSCRENKFRSVIYNKFLINV